MKHPLAVLLLVTALAAPTVSAQTASAQTDQTSVSGTVVSSTTDTLVIRMDDGTQRTFSVRTSTMLPSSRLAAGNRISVRYRPVNGGTFEAENVTLADASMAGAPVTGTNGSATTDPSRGTQPPAASSNEPVPSTTEEDRNLPGAASPLPLLALVGSGAMLTALAMRARRRR